MWDKLLALFKDKNVTDEIQSSVPDVPSMSQSSVESAPRGSNTPQGPSSHIGYNYLKGLDGESEDSSKHLRRFINLNKLLRGRYDGKITTTDAEPEGNSRREDSE